MIAPPWLLASFSCNFLPLYLKKKKQTWIDFHLDSCLWRSLFRLTLFRRKRCFSFHFYPFNVICLKYCVASSKVSSETKSSLHFWAIVEYFQIFKDPAPVYTGVKSYLSKLSSPHQSMRANYCYIHFKRNQKSRMPMWLCLNFHSVLISWSILAQLRKYKTRPPINLAPKRKK